ncbi:DegT/DnrJ/EryC1/StrS family aminotransferase [Petrachloros mirabilis]
MPIPFLDLKAHHQAIRGEIDSAIGEVIDAGAFAGGPFVERFEKEFAEFCGASHAVGVGSGTDALWFVLLGLGIGPGDEVITVPMTFMATTEAISFCGATPVLVDIEPKTYTMDPAKLERAITPRTKAIIPVHLYGQMADMDPILDLAKRHRLHIIEDACQAHGAEYKRRKAGSMGVAGCFSFYPGKNLGAFGEAGAVVTSDESLMKTMQMLRDHGQERKYHHALIGWNGRMDGIQGAVLRVKLKRLAEANRARRAHARLYNELLVATPNVTLPSEAKDRTHVYHVFAVRVPDRDRVMKSLSDRGVGCGVHYPIPIHLQPAYESLGYKLGDFPVAEQCANEFLSLPMFPEMTDVQVKDVVGELNAILRT